MLAIQARRHVSDSIEARFVSFVCNAAMELVQMQKFQKRLRRNINLNSGCEVRSLPGVAVE
jgi:hypothetical protein